MPKVTFLKDVLFLQLVLGMLVLYNLHGRINIWMGAVFILIYAIYVIVSVSLTSGQTQPHSNSTEKLVNKDDDQKAITSGNENSGNVKLPMTDDSEEYFFEF